MIIPSAIALVNEFSASGVRGGSMGVYNTFRLVGFGAGPVAAGAVVNAGPYVVAGREIAGYDAAFYFAALTAATSLVLVTVFIHDPDETIRTGHSGPSSFTVFDDDGGLDPVFTLGLVTLFMAIGIALFATIQVNINEHLDQGSTWFGLQFSAFIVAQILLQTPVGSASDRFGRKPFILWGLVFLVPTTLAQGLVTTSVGMFVARLLQGVAGAMVFAPALALAGDLARGDSGSKLSVLTTAFARCRSRSSFVGIPHLVRSRRSFRVRRGAGGRRRCACLVGDRGDGRRSGSVGRRFFLDSCAGVYETCGDKEKVGSAVQESRNLARLAVLVKRHNPSFSASGDGARLV